MLNIKGQEQKNCSEGGVWISISVIYFMDLEELIFYYLIHIERWNILLFFCKQPNLAYFNFLF